MVEGLILNKSVNLLKAKREAGKSLLAVDLAVALVRGETDWLGRTIAPGTPNGVYFLVTDAGAEVEIARQLARLGIKPEDMVTVARARRGPALVDQWARFGERLRAEGYGLVVIDNGTGLVHDIVKPESVNPLFDGLKELTAPDIGLTVLLVHHEPKMGTGAAGNYSWESEPRWRLSLSKVNGDYRSLVAEGNALSDMPPVIGLRMPRRTHPGSRFTLADDRNIAPEDRSASMDKDDERILKILSHGRADWRNQEEIAKAIGCSQATIARTFDRKGYALRDGQVVKLAPAKG
jgi:hypothetical protein